MTEEQIVEDLALMLTDREFRGWEFHWDHPGVFVWYKNEHALYGTPWYNEDEKINFQLTEDDLSVEVEIPFPIPNFKKPGDKTHHMQILFQDYLLIAKSILEAVDQLIIEAEILKDRDDDSL